MTDGAGFVKLPREVNSFIGRERELEEVAGRLAEAPLVTIVGPGGVGKTRLALRLAHQHAGSAPYTDGVAMIELAPVGADELVPHTIAEMLSVAEQPGQSSLGVLVSALRARQLLLILDNCEHLLAGCADTVTQLLLGCPRLRVLATSREPLRIAGEVVYRIPTLQVPSADQLESLLESEAARLFVDRARAANSAFTLAAANSHAVAEICRRVDGLPLAIELVAARVAALAPAEIARRLDDVIPIAAHGPRSAPPRQQTLEAALAWSFALLEEDERSLLRRMAVFAGGFDLRGAQTVDVDDTDMLDVLSRLVVRSMIQAEPQPNGEVRYRLLEPIRQFAYGRLVESGELEPAWHQQVAYLLNLAEYAGGGILGGLVQRQLNPEVDNVRAALEWALGSGHAELAARLGAVLWPWWTRPDRQAEGRAWLRRILAHVRPRTDSPEWGRVAVGLAYLHLVQGDMADAARLSDDARRVVDVVEDATLAAIAWHVRGRALSYLGAPQAAEPALRESLAQARRAGLDWITVMDLVSLAEIALDNGDTEAAEEAVRESMRTARTGSDAWCRGIALNALGDVMRACGDPERAAAAYEEALPFLASLDPSHTYLPPGILHNLGYVALARGDVQRAASLFLDSADAYRTAGTDCRGLSECIVGLARTAIHAGQATLGARLFGTAEAELEGLGTRLTHANRAEYERGLAELSGLLNPVQLAAARADGRRLRLDDALQSARELTRQTEVSPHDLRGGLTPREHEVALLVARGLSNRQLADELVISEKTAKNHVQRAFDKLGVRSRTQLAIRVRELGLASCDTPP